MVHDNSKFHQEKALGYDWMKHPAVVPGIAQVASQEHGVSVFVPPKAGSESFRQYLKRWDINRHNYYSTEWVRGTFKVAMLRNPYRRFVSGWYHVFHEDLNLHLSNIEESGFFNLHIAPAVYFLPRKNFTPSCMGCKLECRGPQGRPFNCKFLTYGDFDIDFYFILENLKRDEKLFNDIFKTRNIFPHANKGRGRPPQEAFEVSKKRINRLLKDEWRLYIEVLKERNLEHLLDEKDAEGI